MTQVVERIERTQSGNSDFTKASLSRKGYLRVVLQVIACGGSLNEAEREKLLATELLFGAYDPGVYGACFFERWVRDGIQDVIQISAFWATSQEEMWVTMVHECAHVLAGKSAGHGPVWKATAIRLGLIHPKASGEPSIEDLHPDLVTVLKAIPLPTDGMPVCDGQGRRRSKGRSGCKVGIGSREGKSRGPGTGSRLRLWLCQCEPPYRVRVASNDFKALCLRCRAEFVRGDAAPKTSTALVKSGFRFDPQSGVPCAAISEAPRP